MGRLLQGNKGGMIVSSHFLSKHEYNYCIYQRGRTVH